MGARSLGLLPCRITPSQPSASCPRMASTHCSGVPVADAETAGKIFKVLDALEDLDDVQDVYTNIDIPEDVAAALDEE